MSVLLRDCESVRMTPRVSAGVQACLHGDDVRPKRSCLSLFHARASLFLLVCVVQRPHKFQHHEDVDQDADPQATRGRALVNMNLWTRLPRFRVLACLAMRFPGQWHNPTTAKRGS